MSVPGWVVRPSVRRDFSERRLETQRHSDRGGARVIAEGLHGSEGKRVMEPETAGVAEMAHRRPVGQEVLGGGRCKQMASNAYDIEGEES